MKRLLLYTGLVSTLISCAEEEKSDLETTAEATAEDNTDNTQEEDSSTADTNDEPATEDDSADGWDDFCSILDEDKVSYALPATETEAAQVTIVPSDGESYALTKEETAEGWFMLEVPSWMCDVEIYTAAGVVVEMEASADWDLGAVGEAVADCEDTEIVLHSWTFHAWGSYVVHIQAEGETEFWMATRLVE